MESLVEKVTQLQQRLRTDIDQSQNQSTTISWNWVMKETLCFLKRYSSGVSVAVLLCHLQNCWDTHKLEAFPLDPQFYAATSLRPILAGGSSGLSKSTTLQVKIATISTIPNTTIKVAKLNDTKGRELNWYFPGKFEKIIPFVEGYTVRVTNGSLVESAEGGLRLFSECAVFSLSACTEHIAFMDSLKYLVFSEIKSSMINTQVNLCVIVAKISAIKTSSSGYKQQAITLLDQNNNTMLFILSGEQTPISYLFKKTDKILILGALVSTSKDTGKVHLLYSTQTIIFVISADGTGSIQETQLLLSRYNFRTDLLNDMQAKSNERFFLKDLSPGSKNVSVLVNCLAVGPNMPKEHQGVMLSRRLVYCDDESNRVLSITAWGNIADQLKSTRSGQILFFEGLTTTEQNNEGIFFTNSYEVQGGKVYEVSSITAVLRSPFFCSPMQMRQINFETSSSFICKAKITSFQIPQISCPPVCNYHSECGRKVVLFADSLFCRFCDTQVSSCSIKMGFTVKWELSDGTASIQARALPQVNQAILEVDPFDFQSLSPSQCKHIFNNCLFKEFMFLIGKTKGSHFRIDLISNV